MVCKVLELLNSEDAPAAPLPHRSCPSAAHGRRVLSLRGKKQGDGAGGGGLVWWSSAGGGDGTVRSSGIGHCHSSIWSLPTGSGNSLI